ncbi:hypothetical protein K9L97_03830 [Candidatus Woesearchaeota archaeon]|nr:hypothetical protein [Candidatus Woesearchaeota archaeon]
MEDKKRKKLTEEEEIFLLNEEIILELTGMLPDEKYASQRKILDQIITVSKEKNLPVAHIYLALQDQIYQNLVQAPGILINSTLNIDTLCVINYVPNETQKKQAEKIGVNIMSTEQYLKAPIKVAGTIFGYKFLNPTTNNKEHLTNIEKYISKQENEKIPAIILDYQKNK